jgi:type I restriction enzyme S subunit
MGSDWREVCLSELGEMARGKSKHRPRYAEHLYGGIYPFIQTGDVKASSGRISSHRQSYSKAGLAQSRLWPAGTMCITIAANIAETGILEYPACFPDSIIGFIANKKMANVYFIEFLFRDLRKELQRQASGSVQDNINLQTLERLKFRIPPIDEQNRIAAKLNDFENRIHLNNQTNQTLEQMAQALFKSWFVDFDPVIDNALAAGNLIPDGLQARAELRQRVIAERATNPNIKPLPDDIQQLFPSEFEESELGWIPKGWEVTSFESLISLIGGGTPKTTIDDYWGGDIPWFSVVDAPNDSDVFVIDTEKHVTQLGVDKSSTKILREGTTIISARGTVGKCALVGSLMAMNQSCYGIVGKFENHDEYIYFLTRYQVSDLQKRGHGSVFNTITRETFKSISLAKSSDLLTQKFSEMVRPYLTKILSNNKQNIELTKLRDVLLPKLISGELII